eukprot:505624_1
MDAVQQQLLLEMLKDEKEGIATIENFLSLNRKQFAIHVKKYTKNKIKPAACTKLFKSTMNALKHKAQAEAFGEFLSTLDSQKIDVDYHHILHSHIQLGTDRQEEEVFRFFEHTIHLEDRQDTDFVPKECHSFKRSIQKHNEQKHNETNKHDIDIWSLKQHYMQNTLDVIHSRLVHPDWKHFIRKYKIKQEDRDEKIEDEEKEEVITDQKNISDVSEDMRNYSFGLNHHHPDLYSQFSCLKDEILYNASYRIKRRIFNELLIKAIRKHEIALNTYKNNLICKYY